MATNPLSPLDLINQCDNFPYDNSFPTPLYTLHLPHSPHPHGYLLPATVALMPWTPAFTISHENRTVTLSVPSDATSPGEACTEAFATLINLAKEKEIFRTLDSGHGELFPILGVPYPVCIDRFAGDLFGITARGAHMTVYTVSPGEGMKIWVPRRSPHMFTYPNKLDTTVAGGVAAGETPKENVVREAGEEASLDPDIVGKGVKAAGVLTYVSHFEGVEGGKEAYVCPDVVYVYDLEVEGDVVPKPGDGEVKEFSLMRVEEVKRRLRGGEFKGNSAVVMVDFFVRHGIITEENEPDYVEIVQRMHRRLPFPIKP